MSSITISLPTKKVVDALMAVQGIGNHPEIPLAVTLGCVDDEFWIEMAAFDGQVMTRSVAAMSDTPRAHIERVVVPINVLATAARDIPGEMLDISIENGSLRLRDSEGRFEGVFNPMYYDGRERWAETGNEEIYCALSAHRFAEALRRVIIGVSKDALDLGLHVLHGVHVVVEPVAPGKLGAKVTVEATDLYYFLRYTYVDLEENTVLFPSERREFVMPAKAANEIIRAIQGPGFLTSAAKASLRKVSLYQGEGDQITFKVEGENPADGIEIVTDAIGGWGEIVGDKAEALIPKDLPSKLIMPVKELQQAINIAIQSSPDNLKGGDGRIMLTTRNACLEVTGSGSRNRMTLRVPGITGGGEISAPVPVYGRRLQSLLRVLPDSTVCMAFAPLLPNEKPRPLLFTVGNQEALPEGADFFAIMIPIRPKAIQQTPIEPFAGLSSMPELEAIPF